MEKINIEKLENTKNKIRYNSYLNKQIGQRNFYYDLIEKINKKINEGNPHICVTMYEEKFKDYDLSSRQKELQILGIDCDFIGKETSYNVGLTIFASNPIRLELLNDFCEFLKDEKILSEKEYFKIYGE